MWFMYFEYFAWKFNDISHWDIPTHTFSYFLLIHFFIMLVIIQINSKYTFWQEINGKLNRQRH